MKKIGVVILLLLPVFAIAQIGGQSVYQFLNLTPSARIAALGGVNITTYDHDPNFGYYNPALVNDSMHQQLSLSYVNYISDINFGYASYSHTIDGIANFHAGIHYLSYGNFVEADEYGNQTGEFGANDVALVVGAARQVDRFRAGVNLKLINSSIAGYSSFGIAADLGGVYHVEDKGFTVGMMFRNIGTQLSRYTPATERENPPFEIQVGVSKKLEHMPLRFSLTAIHLEHPKLIYEDPDAEPELDLNGEPIEPKSNTVDNIFRHLVFGTEFLISKHVNIRAGYNHLRRKELRSVDRAGLAGFSFGLGIKVNRFILDYSYASYHAIGGTHNLTISTNLGSFKKQ